MAYIGAGISRFNTADELTVTGDAQIDTTTLVVDSTNNRVGVGTASPATALDVAGTVTADGLTVDGGTTDSVTNFTSTDTSALVRFTDGTGSTYAGTTYQNGNGAFAIYTGGDTGGSGSHKSLTIDGGGDVALYDNTGSSQGFYWDASTQRLGLGTTSPNANRNLHLFDSTSGALRIEGTARGGYVEITDGTNTQYIGTPHSIAGSGNSTDLSFWTAGSNRMTIDSSGNVGIGTNSPSTNLEINGGANNNIVRIVSTDANANIEFADNTTTSGLQIGANGDNMKFGISGAEAMRIDSSGNVGIGQTNPSGVNVGCDDLVIGDASGNRGLTILSGATSLGLITFNDGVNTSRTGGFQYDHSSNYLAFRTSDSEAVRIDSSGNVLVGKTTSGTTSTVGTDIRSNGRIQMTVDGDDGLRINRKNSDGEIALFQKDGTTVGYIGANASRVYMAGPSRGIKFGNSSMNPVTASGQGADNSVDLGDSNIRFKDLYLSGGAYLGGTAAANLLDDYEEGTWTPTGATNSGTAATFGSVVGSYVKIGNLVTVNGEVRDVDTTGTTSTSQFRISGLPFAPTSEEYQGSASTNTVTFQGSRTCIQSLINEVSNVVVFFVTGSGASRTAIDNGDITSGTSDFFFTIQYQTF